MRRRLLIAALAALLLPFVLLAVLLHTQAGTDLVVSQLWRLERFGIHIEGVSGTLAGPLRVARFELDRPRVQVISHDIVIDAQLRGLFVQTLSARSVTARDSLVVLREAQMPPSERPPRFLPRFLRIDARGVDLAGVRYVHQNGMTIEARRIQGRVTMSSQELRAHDFRVDASRFDAVGNVHLRAGRPIGMQASASGHLRTNRDVTLSLAAQLDGTFDRLGIKAQMLAPDKLEVDALLTRPEERWNIAGRAVSPALSLAPLLEKPPLSLRNIDLGIEIDPDGITAAGKLGIPELDDNDLSVDARGRYADRTVHITDARLALDGASARAQGHGTIRFDGESPAIDLTAHWQELQWPLRGEPIVASPSGEGTLQGSMPYDFAVNAQVAPRRAPAAQGFARGVISKEEVTLADFNVNTLEGSLSGSGAFGFAEPRAWKLAVRAQDVNPAGLHREFPGRISLTANGEGKGLNERASFTVSLRDLRGRLRGERVQAAGTVQKDGKRWRVNGANASFGEARLSFSGVLRDGIDARWSLHAPSIGKVLPDAAGAIDSTGSISGPLATPHIIADLRGRNLRYQGWSANELTVDADVDGAGTSRSHLSIVAQRLGRGEPAIDTLRVSGEGLPLDHRLQIESTGIAADARREPPRGAMQIEGRYDRKVWTARVIESRLSSGATDEPLTITEPAQIVASREHAKLENLCFVVALGRACAQGEWRRGGSWQATVSGYEIPLASVLPAGSPDAQLAGRFEGRVHAFGEPGQPWQGEAGMRIIDAAIIYSPQGAQPETLNLGTGGLAATATPERIDFSFGIQAFSDTFVYANARLQRDGRNDVLNLPLTGDMRARAADANVLPLVFPEIDRAAGLLTANATVRGTLASPEINGRMELANGEFDTYRINLALRDLNVVADLANTSLDFRGRARAGEGRMDVDGRFNWSDGESSGTLHLRGTDLLVADLPEYRVVASPDLAFNVQGRRIDVAGDVRIPSARIQPAQLTGAIKVSEDARYVDEHPAEKAGRFVVHSEIRVEMGDDVRVEAFGLQGRIVGAVDTTIQTDETPIGRGELRVEEGRYAAYGQSLEISRGRLLFDTSPLDDPGLDIEARRRIESVTVGLNVRGTLQQPRLTFFSDPSMPQTQIVSYLLTGKSTDVMAGTDTMAMESARDTLALQGGGLLASQLGRRLGLEEVGVESTVNSAGEANTALVLGKFLSPRLFISYGISLTESINTLKLRYTISDRWIFRTEAGENQSADLEFTIER